MNKLISKTLIKFPFQRIKIDNNSDFFKKVLNNSKKKIEREKDKLFLIDQKYYLFKTFMNKIELDKEKKINLRKSIINNSYYYNSKNDLDISKLNNEKENDNNKFTNIKKYKPIKNLFYLKLKKNYNKNINDSENESKNNRKIKLNKNRSFENKKIPFKKMKTFRINNKDSLLEKTINKFKTIYFNKSLDNSKKNNNILITNMNCINNNKIDKQKNHKKIYNIKKLIKKSRKSIDDIENNSQKISKIINQNKYLNRFKSEGNIIKSKKILNMIKQKNKKFGKNYDILGPIEKNSLSSIREVRINKDKRKETKTIWMHRTAANIVSFGQVYQEFPDDLFYKERKRIIQDYLTLRNDKKMPIKINKKRLSSSKNLAYNLNKIENMIISYKNLIQKIKKIS